jgi:hypothetical protein
MSMALAGVGFSFGIETSSVMTAMSKISGKMGEVADSFGALREKAVKGIFDSVETGFKGTAAGIKGLGGAMMRGIAGIPGGLFKIGGSALGAGINFTKKLGGPIMGFLSEGPGKAFDAIGSAIGNMFSGNALKSMTDGINLTSSLEGQAVSAGKSAREMGAQFGYTGKDLDKFTSKATAMSISMNVGADAAAKALRGWDEAKKDLQAVGFTSAQGLVKFTESFGVSADTLRNTTMQMRREFGLTDDEIANIVGSTAKMGQVTGDVPAAMNELPEVMKRMREQASLMGVELEGAKLAGFAAQTNALASGFMQMGQNSDDARAQATQFASALVQSENQFAGMFAGVQNELPEFVKELAITTGDANKAFELMESGPAGFVQGMTDMVAAAKKNGTLTDDQMNFVRLRMEKVLGADAAATMTNFFRSADANTLKVMQSTAEATNNLEKMGKEAFRTGRTMQDELEFATERMFDKFRALGKPAARKWLKDTQKAMSQFGDQIKTLGKDKGPVGAFATKMAEAANIGAQALVPDALRPTTMVMGQMLDKFGPTLESLKGLGVNFTSVSGIISGATTTLGLFAADMAMNKKENESWGDAAAKTVRKFGASFAETFKSVGNWLTQAVDWILAVDFDKLFEFGEGEPTSEFDKAIAHVKEILGEWSNPDKWADLAGKIGKGFSKIWTWIAENETVQSSIKTMMDWISNFLMSAVEAIPWGDIFGKIFSGMMTAITAIAKKPLDMLGDVFGADLGENLKVGFKSMGMENMSLGLDTMFDSAEEHANKALTGIDDKGKETFGNSIHTYAEGDTQKMVEAFQLASDQISEIIDALFMHITGSLEGILIQVQSAAEGIVEHLRTIAGMEEALALGSTEARTMTPAQNRERDERISKLTSDEAIHSPMWYFGSKGYETLFNAKMDQLIAAVYTMKVAQTRSATDARPSAATQSMPSGTSRARVPPSVRG